MKTIAMSKLKKGDIFTPQVSLRGREAFEVLSVNEVSVICQSRKHKKAKVSSKQKRGYVYLLKSKDNG